MLCADGTRKFSGKFHASLCQMDCSEPEPARRDCMSSTIQMSGRLIAAARALTGISQEDFAAAARLPVEALRLMEANGSAWLHSEQDADAVNRGFEHFGVIVV